MRQQNRQRQPHRCRRPHWSCSSRNLISHGTADLKMRSAQRIDMHNLKRSPTTRTAALPDYSCKLFLCATNSLATSCPGARVHDTLASLAGLARRSWRGWNGSTKNISGMPGRPNQSRFRSGTTDRPGSDEWAKCRPVLTDTPPEAAAAAAAAAAPPPVATLLVDVAAPPAAHVRQISDPPPTKAVDQPARTDAT